MPAETAKNERQQGAGARSGDQMSLMQDVSDYLQRYARERPREFAMWCLGVGFVLGWKLKPW